MLCWGPRIRLESLCLARLAWARREGIFLSSLISSTQVWAGLPEVDGTWEQRATRWLTVTPFRKAVNAKGSTKDTSTFTCKGNSKGQGGSAEAPRRSAHWAVPKGPGVRSSRRVVTARKGWRNSLKVGREQ